MTSINALRFDAGSGLLACDEQRCWNDEVLKVASCDKIRSVVRPDITAATGLIAYYGHTGTSSIGDEVNVRIGRELARRFDERSAREGRVPDPFLTVEEAALVAFDVMCAVKREHIDMGLKGKFGFNASEFIQGKYEKDGQTVEIKDKKVLETVPKHMTWEGRLDEVTGVFLNAGVLAGYDRREGFRIFLLSMIDPVVEPVSEIFLAEGSGLDWCDHSFALFAGSRTIPERRGAIDRSEGTFVMLEGLENAKDTCAGVGGYTKLIHVDGPAGKTREISSHRSHLASEVVRAAAAGHIGRPAALKLVEDLVFSGRDFAAIDQQFAKAARDPAALARFLRGYRASGRA